MQHSHENTQHTHKHNLFLFLLKTFFIPFYALILKVFCGLMHPYIVDEDRVTHRSQITHTQKAERQCNSHSNHLFFLSKYYSQPNTHNRYCITHSHTHHKLTHEHVSHCNTRTPKYVKHTNKTHNLPNLANPPQFRYTIRKLNNYISPPNSCNESVTL